MWDNEARITSDFKGAPWLSLSLTADSEILAQRRRVAILSPSRRPSLSLACPAATDMSALACSISVAPTRWRYPRAFREVIPGRRLAVALMSRRRWRYPPHARSRTITRTTAVSARGGIAHERWQACPLPH